MKTGTETTTHKWRYHLGMLLLTLCMVGCKGAPHQHAKIQFHMASFNAVHGWSADTEYGEQLYISPEPFCTEADINKAYPIKNQQGETAIGFEFKTESLRTIQKHTRNHAAQPVVLYVDNQLEAVSILHDKPGLRMQINPGSIGFSKAFIDHVIHAFTQH